MFFSTYANNYVCENNYVCYIMLITRGTTRKRETLSDYNIRGNIYNMCFLQKSAYIKRSFRLNSLYIQFFLLKTLVINLFRLPVSHKSEISNYNEL